MSSSQALSQLALKASAVGPSSAMGSKAAGPQAHSAADPSQEGGQPSAASSGRPAAEHCSRACRSQPASPARVRRPASEQQQLGSVAGGPAAGPYGGGASGGAVSPRGQLGFWHRTYGRPSSNPSPSRGAAGSLSASSPHGMTGRGALPARSPGAGVRSSHGLQPKQAGSNDQQLADFFTATALKAPQRYEQSPYLRTTPSRQQGAGSPYSKFGSAGGIEPQQGSSPEPTSRVKLAFGSSASKAASAHDGAYRARGPGALTPSSPSSGTSSSGTGQFRSSSASRRYTASSSNIGSRASTPPGPAGGLTAHKQSLHQHQQQLRQSQPSPQQQQPAERHSKAGQQLSPAASLFQQSQVHMNPSGQLSGLLISASSSTVAGRPQTAKGSSRAELHAEAPAAAVGSTARPGSAGGRGLMHMGINLDPHSWSTFLTLSTSSAAVAADTSSRPSSGRQTVSAAGAAGQQQQQHQAARPSQQPSQQQPVQVPRSLQSQMLSDLGLPANAAPAGISTNSSSSTASSGCVLRQVSHSNAAGVAASSVAAAAGGGAASSPGGCVPRGGSKSILYASQAAVAAAQQQGADAAAMEATSSNGAPALAPGPLHAGLMRPRSANTLLQLAGQGSPVGQQQSPQQAQQHTSSYLMSLQQQQQQRTSIGSPTAPRMPGSQPSTPASAYRRRSSLAETAAAGADAAAAAAGSPLGSTMRASLTPQQRPEAGAPSPDAASGSTSQQQQQLPPTPATLRRVGSCDVGGGGASSPLLSRLAGEWGTLTAMSALRGSGFGLGESSAELSGAACNSTGSWSSASGVPAQLLSSSVACGGAAAAGISGPGPSPLSFSSSSARPGSSIGLAAQAPGCTATPPPAIASGMLNSPDTAGAVRRALNFGSNDGSAAPARLSAQGSAAAASMQAAGDGEGNASGSQRISSQQPAGAASPAGGAAGSDSPKPTQQTMEQCLSQLQQLHQAYKQQLQQSTRFSLSAGEAAAGSQPSQQPAAAGTAASSREAPVAAMTASAAAAGAVSLPPGYASQQQQMQMPSRPAAQPQPPMQSALQPQAQRKRGATTDSEAADDEDMPPSMAGTAAAKASGPVVAAPTSKAGDAVAAAATAGAPAATSSSSSDASEPLLLPGYSVGAVVGEGGFCAVRLAVHHLSRRKVAVKVIDKTKLADPAEARRMQREIRVLKRLNHPCVIRLFEVLEAGQQLLLLMEYAPSGSLLDYVRARKRLGEGEAAFFLQQIVTGLQYCHNSEVVHRDIKLENILLDAGRSMKLIDFGLAAFYAPGKKLRVHCGSPSYAAPEIVGRKLYEGPPVDVWSLGVVLFAMLAGFLPFHSSTGNKQELCQKIMAGTYNAPDYLSPSARDLLGRMLTVDPDARITLAEVAAHPWTRSSGPQWELPTTNCYSLSGTISGSGSGSIHQQQHQVVLIPHGGSSSSSGAASGPQAAPDGGLLGVQASILEELEGHGYSRPAVLRYLAAGEANYMTASYYLLAEARAETAAKLLPQKPWPFQPVVPHSSRSSASRSSTSRAAAAGQAGSGAPRPASGTTSSRPASSGA